MITRSLIFLLCGSALLPGYAAGGAERDAAARNIQVLEAPSSSLKEKADACRELAVTGGRDAVPVLSSLLADPATSHMARYALERIDDSSVDEAFRKALDTLQGRQLSGVITSIGVRRDSRAVQQLGRLLADTDPEVCNAAARALGRIGTGEARRFLFDALGRQMSLSVAEGLMRCADTASPGERIRIYRTLLHPGTPPQVRAGALEGLVVLGGHDGTKQLYRSLRDADPVLFSAALRVLPMVHGTQVTKELMEISQSLGSERRVMLIQAVAERGDPASLPGLCGALKSEEPEIREAAALALGELARSSSAETLLGAARDPDPRVARAAFESLASLQGAEVDKATKDLLNSRKASDRKLGLELAGRRRMTSAIPQVIAIARDDKDLRPIATRRIGDLGGPAQVPIAVDLLLQARKESDIQAAEEALGVLAAKTPDKEKLAAELAARMANADLEQNLVFLRVLGGTGSERALEIVREATQDRDARVRIGAIEVMETWPGTNALPDLLEIARNGSGREQAMALRGYLRFAARAEVPTPQRLEMCRNASRLVKSDESKRQLISAIGSISSADGIKLIEPWLNDPGVKREAEEAMARLKNNKQ